MSLPFNKNNLASDALTSKVGLDKVISKNADDTSESNNNKLFLGNDSNKEGGNGNGRKDRSGLRNILDSSVDFVKENLINPALSTIKDKLTSSNNRNTVDTENYNTENVSIANKHTDAIKGILNDVYQGNLFDAGVNSLQLYNIGTTWKIHTDQWTDKEAYPFRYWYYYQNTTAGKGINLGGSEDPEIKQVDAGFLDTIEDPTILGFALKIDYGNSPLFTGEDLKDFINKYSPHHPELAYALETYSEFIKDIQKIIATPSNDAYRSEYLKNHYVTKIEGLDKLDNLFVNYSSTGDGRLGTSQEALTLILNEDVRLFTTRLAFLYRNLTYSYNMGKKLIPENLLRFNMYIKISDMRSFTRATDVLNDGKDNDDLYRSSIQNGYSRIIYELKDCEFFFEPSLLSSSHSSSVVSSGSNDFSNMSLKIKYRKVNRIFYSTLFDTNFTEFLIGDKFFKPDTTKTFEYLKNDINWNKDYTTQRPVTTNNIPIARGLGEQFDVLKNAGLFSATEKDNALTRFAKTIGNDAVKAGTQAVSDGLQAIKNDINQKVGGSVRDFLQSKIKTKTIDLGVVGNVPKQIKEVHSNTTASIPLTQSKAYISMTGSNESSVAPDKVFPYTTPKEDLAPDTKYVYTNPNGDLMDDTVYEYTSPNGDLMDDTLNIINNPNENLMTGDDVNINIISENVNGNINHQITTPNGDLMDDTVYEYTSPNEKEDGIIHNYITPNENLMGNVNAKINSPNDTLNPTISNKIDGPNDTVYNVNEVPIKMDYEELNSKVDNVIVNPFGSVNENIQSEIVNPNEVLDSKSSTISEPTVKKLDEEIKHKYKQPDKFDSIKSFKDYLKRKKDEGDI